MTFSRATRLIHGQANEDRIHGAVKMPIFQSAMYEHGPGGLRYIRLNNTPNQQSLNHKLAMLEGAEEAVVTGSGMAAISSALLSVLKPGDHMLAQDGMYGGTFSFATNMLRDYGITVQFFDADSPEIWGSLLRPETRALYVESITNPLMKVCDLERAVGFARQHNLVSLIDNTFASPVNFRAAEFGFDLSLHSATKYLNGHSDIVAGAIVGRGDLVRRAEKMLRSLGGSLDPHACFLLDRGLQTLFLRIERHNENAERLAKFLQGHSLVSKVNYPGLSSHPRHARAKQLFSGSGGMISFELHTDVDGADRFIDLLQIPIYAPSLGGVESLVTRPAISSHASLSPSERRHFGIADSLVRVSVGIEPADDLIADFAQTLESIERLAA